MPSTKSTIIYISFALICAIFYFYAHKEEQKYRAVTSFDTCVQAGYEILLTYPETCATPDRRTFSNPTQIKATTTRELPATEATSTATSTDKSNLIVITNVTANQIIKSPLTIHGKARGQWYFEGSFPVVLLDGNGEKIFAGVAQATSDWMSADFVPFEITIPFETIKTATGTLVFNKDNPSGEESRDDKLVLPIRFK